MHKWLEQLPQNVFVNANASVNFYVAGMRPETTYLLQQELTTDLGVVRDDELIRLGALFEGDGRD